MRGTMDTFRREFLKRAGMGIAAAAAGVPLAATQPSKVPSGPETGSFDVRSFGATGDGTSIETAAVIRGMKQAARAGGGPGGVPAGTDAGYAIHRKANVLL